MTPSRMHPDPLPLGTRIKTADGKDLGEIKEVRSDHYVSEKGLIFEEDFFIPFDAIVAVEGDTARIGLNEADLAAAGWEEPPIYEGVGDMVFDSPSDNPVTPDPFGVIAVPHGEPPTVVDGTGNVSRVATTDDLSNPDQPVSDMDKPKEISRAVRPGEVWQDETIAEIEPGEADPGHVHQEGGASYQAGTPTGEAFPASETPAASASHTTADASVAANPAGGMNLPYEERQQPYPGEPDLPWDIDTPVYSADDEHIGVIVNVSPHHVMVEKSRFFGNRNFTIPKTAFHGLKDGNLYLNVPAVALETAGWDTGRYGAGGVDRIIPVAPRNISGTG